MKAREDRRNVMIPARMRREGRWADVRIRNLSSRGLRVESGLTLTRGSYVELYRHHQIIVARVIWVRGNHSGLRTQDAIDVTGLVTGRADAARVSLRVPDAVRSLPRGRPVTRHDRSRNLASMLQFVALAVAAGGCAIAGGQAVRDAFGDPIGIVAARL